ncbi:DUF4251 domain-containing protein [Jejudonia soesokkakensis]|uniref:DUF4251 domain-containing protein n=1 Tax=Jejudonia soesokkakensis TaxID=1323432 RepID=A0ABW2MV08_9FLAO
MKNLLTLLILVLSLVSCTSISTTTTETTLESFEDLQQFVQTKNFEFEADWALPLGGNRINLISNPNYLRLRGDSISTYLPYFGVRRSGFSNTSNTGIQIEGVYTDLKIKDEPSKNKIELNFDVKDESEFYSVHMIIYGNGRTSVSFNSIHRDYIQYEGNIERYLDNK